MSRLNVNVSAREILEGMDSALRPLDMEDRNDIKSSLYRTLGKYFDWVDVTVEDSSSSSGPIVKKGAFSVTFSGLAPKKYVSDLINLIGQENLMERVEDFFEDELGYKIKIYSG